MEIETEPKRTQRAVVLPHAGIVTRDAIPRSRALTTLSSKFDIESFFSRLLAPTLLAFHSLAKVVQLKLSRTP